MNPSHVTQAGFIIKPSSDGVLAHGDWAVSLLVSTKLTADRCIFYIHHYSSPPHAPKCPSSRGEAWAVRTPQASDSLQPLTGLPCCV